MLRSTSSAARTDRAAGGVAGIIAAALLAVGLLGGCSAGAATGPDSLALPGPVTAADVAVTAEVYRTRIDAARGGIQLSVRNDGPVPLTITEARLVSPHVASTPVRERTTTIPAGGTRDLAMLLPAVACPADRADDQDADPDAVAPPEAVLVVRLIDGSTAEVTLPTADRLGQWSEWVAAECLAVAVDTRMALAVRHDPSRDEGPLIGLLLDIEPRPQPPGLGAPPDVQLLSIAAPVLFGLVRSSDGALIPSHELPATVVDGGRAESIPLLLTPARCDAHAIADDKQGTLFRIAVTVDGAPGTVTVVADAETRAALYDAYTRACGL